MSHDPAVCKNPRAVLKHLFTSSYWECDICDKPRQEPVKEKTQEPVVSPWAGVTISGGNWGGITYVPTSTGLGILVAKYQCTKCGARDTFLVDAVATGQTCACGGDLQMIP